MQHHIITLPNGKRKNVRRPYTHDELLDMVWSSYVIVQRDYPTPCWEWTRSKSDKGYGMFRHQKKNWLVSRFAWQEVHGPIPEGLGVLHNCNNPACYNPSHLRLGTQSENAVDMVMCGHQRNTKLTPSDVLEIRRLRASGSSRYALSRRFAVSEQQISKVALRQRWKHLA